MSVYKFEIIRGDETEAVEVECDGIDAIRTEALRAAMDGIRELRGDFWDKPRWVLRVTDESNMTILSLSFLGD